MFARLEPRLAAHNQPTADAIGALAQKLDAIDHEIGSLYERARLLVDEAGTKVSALTTKDLPLQNTDGGSWLALLVAFGAGAITFWGLKRLGAL